MILVLLWGVVFACDWIDLDDGSSVERHVKGLPCSIPRRARLSIAEFRELFEHQQPVILTGYEGLNHHFREVTSKEGMLRDYGDVVITLATANQFSYRKEKRSVREYITTMLAPRTLQDTAGESLYQFGDNGKLFEDSLFQEYTLLPHVDIAHYTLAFGIGGHGSGVPFHTHGPVLQEMLSGSKRWFLTPPEQRPTFDGERTSLQWLDETYDTAAIQHNSSLQLLECVVNAGEALYIPGEWWHSTLNLGPYSSFIAAFL